MLLSMPIFSQPDHISKLFKCGFPKLTDYEYFEYDTVHSLNPHRLKTAENCNVGRIPKHLLTQMIFMRTSAYLVVKNDEIIYEQYWLNYDSSSVMNSFSIAKSVVALLLGIAIDEGHIQSINQHVNDFLPQFSQGLDTTLRIVDLLAMSSGTNWSEDFANINSDIVMAYYGSDLDTIINNIHLSEPPGNRWNYQCGNTLLLAKIIETATHRKLYDYAQEKLWLPLGASHDAYWAKDKSLNGRNKAFCCFYATPRDFAKLGLLVLNKGYYNGKQIVSKEYINTVTSPAYWVTHRKRSVDFYALHFWLVDYKKHKIPYFCGMLGQYIFVIPEENAVVVRFGEMLNELRVMPVPPDVKLYLSAAKHILK